ncbi:MAG: formimidoylglutamate deiminase [Planctomycetota bacterium]|nr:formimidoylglutamate deiminase [Planctomycetota bacterium]
MSLEQIIEADLTWTGEAFEPGVRIKVNEKGVITEVGVFEDAVTTRLAGRALLPGFVNAHSHAFQRGLRGLGESFPKGVGSFWTWREAMYDLVERLDEKLIYELSTQAFREMLASGITTVGEFHYAHHDASESGFAFDEIILKAAAEVGIRIVLLEAYYETGGIGKPLERGQKRFATRSLDEYWAQMDRLEAMIDTSMQSLGVVAHSIRAVPRDTLIALHEESRKRGLVFHMHVEEQPREIEDCLDAYHQTPMAIINESLSVDPRFTSVHCTHTAESDLKEYIEQGGNVCLCPLTEANLGDGLANVPLLMREGGHICIGTDSNSRLCFLEEMRLLEYGQRLRHQERGVCAADDGKLGAPLLTMATMNGARSLGLKAGRIAKDNVADLVSIDLEVPCLQRWEASTLLEGIILGCGNDVISEVCVGGTWHRTRV